MGEREDLYAVVPGESNCGEQAVLIGDPFAESLWPPLPETSPDDPAGPFMPFANTWSISANGAGPERSCIPSEKIIFQRVQRSFPRFERLMR